MTIQEVQTALTAENRRLRGAIKGAVELLDDGATASARGALWTALAEKAT